VLFSEAKFLLLFLPALLLLYAVTPSALRNLLLLAASLLFYAWGEGRYVAVMIASIGITWAFALAIDRAEGRARRAWLAAAVAVNLGLLGYFKYANFLAENLARGLALFGAGDTYTRLAQVHLPIGISFFTFQAMSYAIDVYRREVPAARNPLRVAVFKSLFPQLIAGPIVRYVDIAHEIGHRRVGADGFAEGVRRFVLGLAKKILIANVLAVPADAIFGRPPGELSAALAWLGALCYTGQIYFDFSGYSDMAIGLGRMFGFHFLENFEHPYAATSVTDFWRRWHISLSSWFRDYLYIPLGGNRCRPARVYFNLLTVFLLCGLWHGAAWTFLAWGLYHGLFLVAERRWARRRGGRGALPSGPLGHAYLVLAVVVGWVLFRAPSIGHAVDYLGAMAGLGTGTSRYAPEVFLTRKFLVAAVAAVVFSTPRPAAWLRTLGLWPEPAGAPTARTRLAGAVSTFAVLALMLLSLVQIAEQSYNPFIYFRF
jgi:alginate O-acetyltransferase complex protein AlgI